MKSKIIVGFIIGLFLIGGCSQTSLNDGSQVQTKLSTREPSEMVLELDDFPEGFEIKNRGPMLSSDAFDIEIEFGWIEGYEISFIDNGENPFDVTLIEQYISIYPSENIEVIANKGFTSAKFEVLPSPGIGEGSRAFKIREINEFSDEEDIYYLIEFRKKDVLEQLYISGARVDYELLKSLAKKAASKVK